MNNTITFTITMDHILEVVAAMNEYGELFTKPEMIDEETKQKIMENAIRNINSMSFYHHIESAVYDYLR